MTRPLRIAAVYLAAALLLIVALSGVAARGQYEAADMIRAEGRITISGNYPHTFVALNLFEKIDGNGSYRLTGDLAEELRRDYQQKVVTLRLRVTKDALGPGAPAEAEVIEITSVKS